MDISTSEMERRALFDQAQLDLHLQQQQQRPLGNGSSDQDVINHRERLIHPHYDVPDRRLQSHNHPSYPHLHNPHSRSSESHHSSADYRYPPQRLQSDEYLRTQIGFGQLPQSLPVHQQEQNDQHFLQQDNFNRQQQEQPSPVDSEKQNVATRKISSDSKPNSNVETTTFDIKKEAAGKGEDNDDGGGDVDENEREEERKLENIDAAGDVTKLHALVQSMDPVKVWCGVRNKIKSHFSLWDLIWDISSTTSNSEDKKLNYVPIQTLQNIVIETGVILEELAALLDRCCDKIEDVKNETNDFISIDFPRLRKSLNTSSTTAVRFKLKPLEEIEPKFRKRLFEGQLQSASEAHTSTSFRTDKVLQIKLETFDELNDDDISVDNDNVDNDDVGDEEDEEIDEKEGFDVFKEKRKPNASKKSRPKRKLKEELEEFDEDEFDDEEDEEDSVDVKKKRRKYLLRNSGPPFDCRSCESSFDVYTTYRYHVKKCEGTPQRKKPPFIRVEKRYYCAHSDCLPPPLPNSLSGAAPAKSKIVPGDHQESWSSVTYIWRHFTETHATDDDLVYPCTYCSEKFLTKGLQKTHVYNKHELRYTCRFCGLSFALGTTLRKHERVHTGEKPFQCDHCNFRCSRSSSLRTHERRRHGVGLQGGPAAGLQTAADGSSVTGNGASNSNGLNPVSQTNGRSHVCEVCGKAFFTKQTLQDHHVTHTGARPYQCPVCGKTLRNDSCLRRHMMGVHGIKQTCNLCGKDFSSKSGLQHHQRDFHGIPF